MSIRNYALLQGESMDRLVDLSSKKALSDTIDTLAGISILKGICDTSCKMAKMADSLYQTKDSENSKNDIAKQKEKENRSTFLLDCFIYRMSCILFKPIISVDVLCNKADVAGCRIPATPSTISPVLNPTMNL